MTCGCFSPCRDAYCRNEHIRPQLRRSDSMATKTAAPKAPKREPGVIDIQLTAEQREQLKRQSKGTLDISALRLRPELNLRLYELSVVLGAGLKIRQGIANGGGSYWV